MVSGFVEANACIESAILILDWTNEMGLLKVKKKVSLHEGSETRGGNQPTNNGGNRLISYQLR
jgi:hypothetical protein